MTWTKLDDGILDHPKLARVGALGFAWYIAGLVYCNRHLTDGVIPAPVARRLLPGPSRRVLAALLKENLWTFCNQEFHVHDFLTYNPSREAIAQRRESWKERQSRRRGVTPASRRDSPVTHASPVPVPVPKRKREAARAIPDDFTATTERLAMIRDVGCRNAAAAFADFRDSALEHGRRYVDWPAAWRSWVRKHGIDFGCPCGVRRGDGQSRARAAGAVVAALPTQREAPTPEGRAMFSGLLASLEGRGPR